MYLQSRLNMLEGPGPARLMGPLLSLWPTWRGGGVVLCTSEPGNTPLGPNQGQTTCFNMPKCMKTGGTCTLHKKL